MGLALLIFFGIVIVGLLVFTGQVHLVTDVIDKTRRICQSTECAKYNGVTIHSLTDVACLVTLIIGALFAAWLIWGWMHPASQSDALDAYRAQQNLDHWLD